MGLTGWRLISCYSLKSGKLYDGAGCIAETTHVQFSFARYADDQVAESVMGVASVEELKDLLMGAKVLSEAPA